MRVTLLIVLLCGLASPALAQGKQDISFRLYQVAGRTWTTKSTPVSSGDGNLDIGYARHEVLEVHETYALCSSLRLDQNKKVPKGVEPSEYRVELKPDIYPFAAPGGATMLGTESVKAAGLTFECELWSSGNPPTRYYRSTRYPGLVVKVEAGFGREELVEFDAFKEDEPPPPPKKGGKKGDKEPPKAEEEPASEPGFALFKAKRSWLIREQSAAGEVYRRYEVIKVEAQGADLKVTELDAARKPVKGKQEVVRVDFADTESPWINPPAGARKNRAEKRKTAFGLMDCVVYDVKVDGQDRQMWYAARYPGLLVRARLGDKGKGGTWELVEFKE